MIEVFIKENGKKMKVKDGYAKNYLIPKGLAVIADQETEKVFQRKKEKIDQVLAEKKAELEKIAQAINGKEIVIKGEVGKDDKLYGSVTSLDIASAVKEQLNLEVDKRKIILETPIKTLGDYSVKLHFSPEIEARFQVKVLAA